MFVKILRGNSESIYQCTRSEWVVDEDNRSGTLNLFQSEGIMLSERVECIYGNQIFMMSDDGRTIDRKRWN